MTQSRHAAHAQRHNDEINRVRVAFDTWSDDIPLNENETAIAIGMSRSWLKSARQNDTGPKHFLINGSVVRYRVGAVREWLQQNQTDAATAKRGGRRLKSAEAAAL